MTNIRGSKRNHDSALERLGFPPLFAVADRLSIADLYPSHRKRCGVYVIEYADGTHYVGKTIDVVSRFGAHRKAPPDIARFSFFRTLRGELDTQERRCIRASEASGLRLHNRMLVRQPVMDSDLDDVVSPDEQRDWLTDPSQFTSEARLNLDPEGTQRLRFHVRFERLKKDPAFERVVRLLTAYIDGCVPVPRRTEKSFWNVSCLPASGPRWATVSMGEMEMFVVGWRPVTREPWAFLNVSRSACPPSMMTRLKRRGIEFPRNIRYRAAAGDDRTLLTDSTFSAMAALLRDPEVLSAARKLSLNVMRKRPNWYAKYHCLDLADRVL